MSRLPVVGSDLDQWGTILDDFLRVSHNEDGTLKGAVTNVLNVKSYGAVGDGVTDDTAALNAAIAALNSAPNQALYLPPATYAATAALSTITQSNVKIFGAGRASRIKYVGGGNTRGTFFQVGADGGAVTSAVEICDLDLWCANNPSASESAFMLTNTVRVYIHNIGTATISGFAKVGTGTNCQDTVIRDVYGTFYGTNAAQGIIWTQRAIGIYVDNIDLAASNAVAPAGVAGIFVDSQSNIDTGWWHNVTIAAQSGMEFSVKATATNGQLVTQWFTDCVCDQSQTATVEIVNNSTTHALSHLWFTNFTGTPLTGQVVRITNTASANLHNIWFDGCSFYAKNVVPVVVTGGGSIRNINFNHTLIGDGTPGIVKAAAMQFACGDFTVANCQFYGQTTAPTGFQYAIQTTADVDNFTVTGNKAQNTTAGFFNHFAYAANSVKRVVSGNVGFGAAQVDRTQLLAIAAGVISESMSPIMYSTNGAPTTQTAYGSLVGLRAGDVLTGIVLRNQTAAAGTLPTTVRFGLADTTGKILVLSGNLNALANWGQGALLFPFTAVYTVPFDGGYYPVFVVNGTWGTTQPAPLRGLAGQFAGNQISGKAPLVMQQAGLTDLPAINSSLTVANGGTVYYYMGVY